MYHCSRICCVLAKNENRISTRLLNVQEVLKTPVEAIAYIKKIKKPSNVTKAWSNTPKPTSLSKPTSKDTPKAQGPPKATIEDATKEFAKQKSRWI